MDASSLPPLSLMEEAASGWRAEFQHTYTAQGTTQKPTSENSLVATSGDGSPTHRRVPFSDPATETQVRRTIRNVVYHTQKTQGSATSQQRSLQIQLPTTSHSGIPILYERVA